MTTEDDFQNALDIEPGDWLTHLVFADWLDEHSDPRAAGYRALGKLEVAASKYRLPNREEWVWYKTTSWLPEFWYALISAEESHYNPRLFNTRETCKAFATARIARDAAAVAFVLLSPEDQKTALFYVQG